MHDEYSFQSYLSYIRNPDIREIYTRLRIDMNVLLTSKIHSNQDNTTCFLCQNGTETVDHFLFNCTKFNNIRVEKFEKIKENDPNFINLSNEDKLIYILDLRCPERNIGLCCNFVATIYKQRENDNVLKPD